MSTFEALWIVAAVIGVSLPTVYRQIRRANQVVESERDRIIREAHARAAAAREVDDLVLAALPAHDPAWNAGLERLWDAIRDEQQNGDHT